MLQVRTQGLLGKVADILMMPLMVLLQWSILEKPQRTHRWNNYRLSASELSCLNVQVMTSVPGVPHARRRWLGKIPLFHLPIFGGWRTFVVLEPIAECSQWQVGWLPDDYQPGISMIPLSGSVRMLVGPDPVKFFGVTQHGVQIELRIAGFGTVGRAAKYGKIPLL